MANDTQKKPGSEQATASKVPDKQASGQVGPPEEKSGPQKVVTFEQVKTAAKEAPAEPGKVAPAQESPMSGKGGGMG